MASRKHTFSRNHSDAQIARALLDAQLFGDKRAAEMHGVFFKTIVGWRRRITPTISEAMDRLRVEARQGWIDEARDARRALVQLVLERARGSKNLRATTEALRRVNEVVMAHEIVTDPDAEPDLADQPEDQGEAEGEGGEA